jgi:hypothetical protein
MVGIRLEEIKEAAFCKTTFLGGKITVARLTTGKG